MTVTYLDELIKAQAELQKLKERLAHEFHNNEICQKCRGDNDYHYCVMNLFSRSCEWWESIK